MGSEAHSWPLLLERCLLNRIAAAKFEAFAKLLDQTPISRTRLAQVFLDPAVSRCKTMIDPLLPQYIETLVKLDLVGPDDLLEVLHRHSRLHQSDAAHDHVEPNGTDANAGAPRRRNPVELDEMVLLGMARLFQSGQRPKSPREVYRVLKAMSAWMCTVVAAGTADEMMQNVTGQASQVSAESQAITMAVGMLMTNIAENNKVLSVLGGSIAKEIRGALSQALSLFIPVISQSAPHIANRLEAFQRANNLLPGRPGKDGDKSMDGVDGGPLALDSLAGLSAVEGPVIHSRAGLYIFLHALLGGRPITDDGVILSHLSARYKGEIANLTTDLIVAAFDVLSYASFRNESQETRFLLRSFLINKIPVLLTTLSISMFPPLTPEFCIGQALTHVDTQAFPTLSSMFDASNDGSGFISDVRQDFLFACCLHGLIPESSIEPLLGEIPMQELPPGGKYTRELLMSQCANDPSRIETLLGEVEGMDGNAGAVVGAIIEVIRNMCTARNTISLKPICTSLARRPSSLDVMLCFASPASILHPICELLDAWRYEEDQGEYQPSYEEFGCILLLVLAFVHRYDLTALDLGVTDNGSFIAQLLQSADTAQRIDELSEERSKQLGGWIRGLFEPENGITDELMSSCRPQDFYMLVPALFSQSVLAGHAGVMSMDTLKGGLEYTLETFLLPALVSAISWLSHHMWEAHGDIDVVMQVLQVIVKPRSISGDAEIVHGVVLSLVGKKLECALRELRRRNPARNDTNSMIQDLQPKIALKRTMASHHTELESWTSQGHGGLLASLRATIQSLVMWSTAPDINMTPASYTHRHPLVAVRLVGARAVIQAILEEMKLQSQNDSGELALDIATSIIVASTVDDVPIVGSTLNNGSMDQSRQTQASSQQPPQPLYRPKTRLTLREALKLEHDETAPKISMTDPLRAENIIRLHRRVEAHYAGVAAATAATAAAEAAAAVAGAHDLNVPVALDVSVVAGAADMMQELDVAAAAAGMGVDVSMDPLGLEQATSAAAGGSLDDVLGQAAAAAGLMGGPGAADLNVIDVDPQASGMDGLGDAAGTGFDLGL